MELWYEGVVDAGVLEVEWSFGEWSEGERSVGMEGTAGGSQGRSLIFLHAWHVGRAIQCHIGRITPRMKGT